MRTTRAERDMLKGMATGRTRADAVTLDLIKDFEQAIVLLKRTSQENTLDRLEILRFIGNE